MRRLSCSVAVLAVCLASLSSSNANAYYVSHTFDLQPGGNLAPTGWWSHHEGALAWGHGVSVGPVPGNLGSIWTIGGDRSLGPSTASAAVGGNTAVANSSMSCSATPGRVAGTQTVWGGVTTARDPQSWGARAWSTSKVTVQGRQTAAYGHIKWGRTIRTTVIGTEGYSRAIDPIDFEILDEDTGEILLADTLLSIEMRVSGVGHITWGSEGYTNVDAVSVAAREASIHIRLSSQYIPQEQRGTLDLVIVDGSVQTSSATGAFASYYLPAIGSIGTFDAANWTNDIAFDYELPQFSGNVSYRLNMGGEGEDHDAGSVLPEPGSLLALGSGLIGLAGMAVRRRR